MFRTKEEPYNDVNISQKPEYVIRTLQSIKDQHKKRKLLPKIEPEAKLILRA